MQQKKPWERYQQQGVQTKAPDPKLPGELQGQDLTNTGRALSNQGAQNDLIWGPRKTIGEIRKEFDSLGVVKRLNDSLPAINRALVAPDTPAGDQAIVYAFGKIMDPSSSVREGEQQAASSIGSFTGQVGAWLRAYDEGKRLPKEARAYLSEAIRTEGKTLIQLYDAERAEYSDLAGRYGVQPIDIVGRHPVEALLGKGQTIDDWINQRPQEPPPSLKKEGLEISGKGSKFATEDDRRFRNMAQEAFDKGASFDDLNKLAVQNGYAPYGQDLLQAISYRDGTGEFANQGPQGGAQIAAPESGFRSPIERAVGAVADSPLGAAGISAGNAATFGGLDEIAGVLSGQGAADRVQFAKEYSREQNPWPSLAGDVVGAAPTFAAGIGLSRLALPNAPKLATFAGNVLAGGSRGALEENDNRLLGAGVGAGAALAGDAVGRYVVAPAARALIDKVPPINWAVNKVGGMFGRKVPNRPAPEQALIAKESAGDAVQNLSDAERLGLPYTMADAAPSLSMLAGSAARKAPSVLDNASDFLESRALGQGERLQQAIANDLAPPVDLKATAEQLRQQARAAAQPHYDAFYGEAAKPITPELASIFQTPFGKQASNSAAVIAANRRNVPFDGPEMLDLTKKSMDDILEAGRDPITREYSNAAREQLALRDQFRSQVDELYPSYGQARQAYQQNIAPRSDLEAGAKAIAPSVPPSAVSQGLKNAASPDHFRQGYASALRDQIDNIGYTHDPFKRIYGTPNQRAKVSELFPQGADDFTRRFQLERDMARTNYNVGGGSPTQARAMADSRFEGMADAVETGANAMFDAATGSPLGAMKGLLRNKIPDAIRFGFGKRGEALAERVAPVLLDPNPRFARDYLEQAQQEYMRRLAYDRKFGRVGGMFGAGAALPLITN